VTNVAKSRKSVGAIAFGALLWGAMRFFQSLVRGVNRAWGTKEYAWWKLPIQNFFMFWIVASALFLGVLAPLAINLVEWFFWTSAAEAGLSLGWFQPVFWLSRQFVPLLVLFYGFSMLYKFAPQRRTPFSDVWVAAVLVTLGLELLQRLFILYATNLGDFNRLYGALGGVVAFLMWIYLTGSIIIFGACIAAAQYEVRMRLTDQSEKSTI
jgi:Ca2+-transporting ATPase